MSKTNPKTLVAAKKENPKKRKLYLARLEAENLPAEPIIPQPKPIRQFQLAHLAATLAKGADFDTGVSEVTAKALQVWNAAGKTLVTAAQADVLAKGLLVMDRQDWEIYTESLIASMDDMHGAVPGHNQQDVIKQSRENARAKAGLAACQAWKIGPGSDDTLKYWFPGKAETVETRKLKFYDLVAYAAKAAEEADELPWRSKDGNKLKSSILSAWAPLGAPDEKPIELALVMAEVFLKKFGEIELKKNMVSVSPLLARWLTVMRQDQLALAKNRIQHT
jgi:hypothetical protein